MATKNPPCTAIGPDCPVELTFYAYLPNIPVNVAFTAFFAICFVVHIWLGRKFKTRGYAIAMSLGCLGLATGYGGRIALHYFPFFGTPFQVQICCLVISPAFNSAAIYLVLQDIVEIFGRDWSILKPRDYTRVFIAADVVSLILQGTGGGLAATARGSEKRLHIGNKFLMTGISFQVLALLTFFLLVALYYIRRRRAIANMRSDARNSGLTYQHSKVAAFFGGLMVAFLLIFARCVYRIVEMQGGWRNPIMRDEVTFIALEGA